MQCNFGADSADRDPPTFNDVKKNRHSSQMYAIQVQIVLTGEGSGQVNVTAMALGPAGEPFIPLVRFPFKKGAPQKQVREPLGTAGEPFAKSTYLSNVPLQKRNSPKVGIGNLTNLPIGPAGEPLTKST